MSTNGPVPNATAAGATMQPRYMGRVVNTYPVSESEMEMISSLSAQATIRFSAASLLLGISVSIWTNAMFVEKLSPAGILAAKFAAPLVLLFAVGFLIAGFWAQYRRKSKWDSLKKESVPMQTPYP